MKKTTSVIIAILMICSAFAMPSPAFAEYTGVWVGNDYYQYEIIDAGAKTARIKKHSQHNDNASVLEIPSSIDGYKITEIGEQAFSKSFDSIKEYVIPSTVTVIDYMAFHQGTNSKVERLTIPSNVKTIGGSAFSSMKYLKSLTISEGVTEIGKSAFYGEDVLTSVTIPSSMRTIGNSAFASCDALSTLTIKNGVQTIGDDAFAFTSIKSVVVPKSVTSIGRCAFESSKLQKATVMNPKCTIAPDSLIFYASDTCKNGGKVKLYGFDNSTLQAYVRQYGYSYQFVSLTTPTASKITKLTPKKKAFASKWSKSSTCMGYKLQYSLKKNMSGAKTVTINSSSTLTKTIKNLKKGKKYYVRVRAFNKYSGKMYYSNWSAVKSVKTK